MSITLSCAVEYVEYVYRRRPVYPGEFVVLDVTVSVTDARRPRWTGFSSSI